MPLGILGNKIGMTQIIDEFGNFVPVTILRAGPCTVTQIKTEETDGYSAVQLGYAQVSSKVLNNALMSPSLEFKTDANSSFCVLAKLKPSIILENNTKLKDLKKFESARLLNSFRWVAE